MTALPAATDRDATALERAFERYHVAWEANDADAIAALHSADSWFWLHDGSARIEGREAIRRHYVQLFDRYDSFVFEPKRTLFGEGRWVFDYTLVVTLKGPDGTPITARLDMVDVVDVNAACEVTRKDIFLDAAAARAVQALAA